MKYKQEIETKLDAVLNMARTVHDALEGNKPYTKQELAQITKNMERIIQFILERLELESD